MEHHDTTFIAPRSPLRAAHGTLLLLALVGFPFALSAAPAPPPSEPSATGVECPSVPRLDALLERSRVLVFGELHGTAQSPEMIGDMVCQLLSEGHRVTLGLELPRDEQALLDAFLESTSSQGSSGEKGNRQSTVDESRAALLDAPFWSHSKPDGRTSVAMLNLLDRVRQLNGQELPVKVVAFDIPFGGDRRSREDEMASYLRKAITAAPEDVVVVLTGNLHSRIEKGSFFPLAGQIRQSVPQLLSLDVSHQGGTAFLCLMGPKGCGMQEVGPRNGGRSRGIHLLEEPDRFGHSGLYGVGTLTGSPPAATADDEAKETP